MDSPPPSLSSPRSAAFVVLSDPVLLSLVTSFQAGLPFELYAFWLQHAPAAQAINANNLQHLIATNGSMRLMELLMGVQFRGRHETPASIVKRCLMSSIRSNRVHVVQWAFSDQALSEGLGLPSWALWHHACEHYRASDLAIFELLKTHRPILASEFESVYSLYGVPENVDVCLLQWLRDNLSLDFTSRAQHIVSFGVIRGDLELVRYVHDQLSSSCTTVRTFDLVLKHSRVEILEYLAQRHSDATDDPMGDYWFQQKVVEHENPAFLALATKHYRAFRLGHTYLLYLAVDRDDFEQIEHWYKSGWLTKIAPISIDRLTNYRNALEAVRFLHETGLAMATTDAMDNAAGRDAWEVVDYLHEHRTEGCTSRAVEGAVRRDKRERVRFFLDNYLVSGLSWAMAWAAADRSIDLLRVLHDHPSTECSTQAMDYAATAGRLHIVKFLHEHRSEGCTTDAIDEAAKAGHAHVVQFLLENRSEGFTTSAIQGALKKNSHVDIVQLLFRHSPDLFGPDLLHDVLLRGVFGIYMQLLKLYPQKANSVLKKAMKNAGKQMELPTVRFIIDVLGRQDLAHRAVDGAVSCCNLTWLRALLAVTGPDSCRHSAVRKAIASLEQQREWDPKRWECVVFLVNASSDAAALQSAIDEANATHNLAWLKELIINKATSGQYPSWLEELTSTDPKVSRYLPPLHPLLLDPRTRAWAIRIVSDDTHQDYDDFLKRPGPLTWAVRAVQKRDVALLAAIRDLPASTEEVSLGLSLDSTTTNLFSFEGARVAAVQRGHFEILTWLLQNVDHPIEPTLLDEAVYYHRYEIAEWLVVNCPEACTALDWTDKGRERVSRDFGLRDGLLDWLESHHAVREALCFTGIIDFAARKNDVVSLQWLHEWYPELFTPRPALLELTHRGECRDTINFLLEIGWSPDVFCGAC